MQVRKYTFSICLLVLLGTIGDHDMSRAQQIPSPSYQAISDRFFNMLQKGDGSGAVEYMFGTNPAMQKVPDKVDQLKEQFSSFPSLAGSYISHTLLAETNVAGMFVYQHYFVAYERQPISVRVKYYKPHATWLCYGLEFDTDLDDHIQRTVDARIPIEMK